MVIIGCCWLRYYNTVYWSMSANQDYDQLSAAVEYESYGLTQFNYAVNVRTHRIKFVDLCIRVAPSCPD